MANWTLSTETNPYHGRARKGAGTPSVMYFQESTCASSATIKRGDIVSQDTTVSTGGFRIRRAYHGGGQETNLLAIAQHIVGIALETSTSDGSNSGLVDLSSTPGQIVSKKIGVAIADPETEFVGYLRSTAASNAQPVSGSSLIGSNKAVRYDSTNHTFEIDYINSTVALHTITITGIPDNTEGDTNGPVYFKFLSSNVSEAVS
jgi:hypothetical protein